MNVPRQTAVKRPPLRIASTGRRPTGGGGVLRAARHGGSGHAPTLERHRLLAQNLARAREHRVDEKGPGSPSARKAPWSVRTVGSRPGQNRQDPHQVVPELLHEVFEEAGGGLVDDLPVVTEALRRELDVGLG